MPALAETAISMLRLPLVRSARGPVLEDITLPALRARLGRPLEVTVVRFDGIGDWILSLPLVIALADSPDVAAVRLAGPASHASLLETPFVQEYQRWMGGSVLQPPAPGGLPGKIRAVSAETGRRALLAGRASTAADLVVLSRWDTDLGQNARAWAVGTGAPIVGFDPRLVPSATWRERAEHAVLSQPVRDAGPSAHETTRAATLLDALGLPSEIQHGYGRRFFGVERADQAGPTGRPVIALHTSSVEPKRRWPRERWAALIETLVSRGLSVALIGAPSEREELESLRQAAPGHVENCAGEPLSELPRRLARAHAFIGNDSGPMHVAASLDIPVVGISPHPIGGDSSHRNAPERFGPWASRALMIRPLASAPCTDACERSEPHCILGVSVQDVMKGLDSVTGPLPSSRSSL